MEGWGEDAPGGDVTSFSMAEMEAAGISMADVPFDAKRMIFGGFEVLVES